MSVESSNQLAMQNDGRAKKKRSVFKYCNNIISRITSSSSKSSTSMLTTDAVPLDHSLQRNQMQSNGLDRISPPQLAVIPPNDVAVSAHLVQNNLNQANQNITVIEQQQNLHFTHVNGLQFGNTYHISGPESRKNSCSSNPDDKIKPNKTKSIVGEHFFNIFFHLFVFTIVFYSLICHLELMNCPDLVESDDPILRISARCMGDNWRMVIRDLGISESEISHLTEQYFHVSVEEVIYKLLLIWQRNSDEPSIGILTTILWNNKNFECVYELKKHFKKMRKQSTNSVVEREETE